MQKVLKALGYLAHAGAALGGITAFFGYIPAQYANSNLVFVLIAVSALGSLLHRTAIDLGDILDDGQANGSFKPEFKGPALLAALLIPALFMGGCADTSTGGTGTSTSSSAVTSSTSSSTTTTTDSSTTTTVTIVAPADNAKFVTAVSTSQSLLYIGGTLALATQDSATRIEIAGYLSGFGHVYASYYGGTLPTDAEFTSALSLYFPTTSANYTLYASVALSGLQSIRLVINTYVPSTYTNKAAYVEYALNALAVTSYKLGDSVLGTSTSTAFMFINGRAIYCPGAIRLAYMTYQL